MPTLIIVLGLLNATVPFSILIATTANKASNNVIIVNFFVSMGEILVKLPSSAYLFSTLLYVQLLHVCISFPVHHTQPASDEVVLSKKRTGEDISRHFGNVISEYEAIILCKKRGMRIFIYTI